MIPWTGARPPCYHWDLMLAAGIAAQLVFFSSLPGRALAIWWVGITLSQDQNRRD